jgi:hypothetical protein
MSLMSEREQSLSTAGRGFPRDIGIVASIEGDSLWFNTFCNAGSNLGLKSSIFPTSSTIKT